MRGAELLLCGHLEDLLQFRQQLRHRSPRLERGHPADPDRTLKGIFARLHFRGMKVHCEFAQKKDSKVERRKNLIYFFSLRGEFTCRVRHFCLGALCTNLFSFVQFSLACRDRSFLLGQNFGQVENYDHFISFRPTFGTFIWEFFLFRSWFREGPVPPWDPWLGTEQRFRPLRPEIYVFSSIYSPLSIYFILLAKGKIFLPYLIWRGENERKTTNFNFNNFNLNFKFINKPLSQSSPFLSPECIRLSSQKSFFPYFFLKKIKYRKNKFLFCRILWKFNSLPLLRRRLLHRRQEFADLPWIRKGHAW